MVDAINKDAKCKEYAFNCHRHVGNVILWNMYVSIYVPISQ
jgi:hypothetical protein